MTTLYDQVLNYLNTDNVNQVPLTLADITFSNPVPSNITVDNTLITVSAIAGSGYEGSVELYYNRIDFAELGSTVWLFSDIEFTTDIVISLLNTDRNCIFLDNTDIATLNIPYMVSGDVASVILTAQENSINWTGSTVLSLFMGFPIISNTLHELVNTTFPAPGYLN